MPDPQLDLAALLREGEYKLSLTPQESEAEAEARRRETAEKAKHARRIQFWSFVVASVCVLASLLFCGYVLATGSPDDKKVVAPIATALVSGLVGYAVGQKAG